MTRSALLPASAARRARRPRRAGRPARGGLRLPAAKAPRAARRRRRTARNRLPGRGRSRSSPSRSSTRSTRSARSRRSSRCRSPRASPAWSSACASPRATRSSTGAGRWSRSSPSATGSRVDAARAALEQGRGGAGRGASRARAPREAVNAKNPGLIRGEEVETWRTRVARRRRPRSRARSAALEHAELNLRDAYVRAPVAGVIQTRTVADRPVRAAGHGAGDAGAPRSAAAALPTCPRPTRRRSRPGMTARFTRARATRRATRADDHARRRRRPTRRRAWSRSPPRSTIRAPAQLRPGAFAEVHGAGRRGADAAGDPADRDPAERARLPRLRGRGRAWRASACSSSACAPPTAGSRCAPASRAGEPLVVRGAEALRDGAKVQVGAAPGSGSRRDRRRRDERSAAP